MTLACKNSETLLIYPRAETLFPFQEKAILQMLIFLRRNKAAACYNACEMGLGKTPMALVALATQLDHVLHPRILIVCPAVVRLVWQEEISRWFPNKKVCVITSGKDALPPDFNFVVVSYDLASAEPLLGKLEVRLWDALVMDESHYLKNSKTKRTKAVLQRLWPRAVYKIALSGTPFTTRIVDGYTLFRRMLPGRWPDFASFADEFSYKQMRRIGGGRVITDYFGVKNVDVLRKLIRDNFYVRYTKEEVLPELPPKIFTRITLPIKFAVEPKSKHEHDDLIIEAELIRRAIEEGQNLPLIPKSLAEHRRLQGERKVPAVVDFVRDLLEQNIAVVVFAWHRAVVSAIRKEFEAYRPAVITGDTPAGEREEQVKLFQERQTLLFIGNYIAAGVGITLTAAATVVCAELDWSPTTVNQAIDRLHRIGQKNSVNIYYFVVKNSLDEAISNTVIARSKIFKSVLDENQVK